MASVFDTNIANIRGFLEEANTRARELKSYRFEGTTYSPEEIVSVLIPKLQTRLENAEKQKTQASEKAASQKAETAVVDVQTNKVLRDINKEIGRMEAVAESVYNSWISGERTADQYKSFLDDLNKLKTDKSAIESGAKAVTTRGGGRVNYQITSPAPKTGGVQTAPSAADAKRAREVMMGAGEVARQDMVTPKPVSSELKVINGETVRVDTLPDGKVVTSKDITSPSNTATTTSTTTAGAGGTGKTGGKGKGGAGVSAAAEKGIGKPVSSNWEPKFREMFPAKVWLLDLDRAKYPKLFSLIQKAMDEKYYESAEGKARFEEELKGTDFYQELALSGKARVVKSLVGDLGFDSTDFSKFLSDAINFGWDNDTLKQKTYEEVFRRNPDGTLANPTALARARKSNDYLNVQLIATRYFNKASDSTIESVLTGRITTEDFQRQQREIAKSKYSHLAPLIDQGVTLDDLASNFKTSAARLLEVDPETIDMGSADYEIALSFGEEGKKRVMTTGEWERLLRTDSRYGWEKTENAKAEARSLASNIAQAFGRII